MLSSALAVVAVAAQILVADGSGAAGLPQAFVEEAYGDLAPAVCMLSFSLEVTNPSSGKTARRDRRALGLIVSADGLVMTHGHMKTQNAEPDNIRVTLDQNGDEKDYDASLLRKPEDVNVCFLRIEHDEPLDLPYVRFKADGDLDLGEPVMLLGVLNPSLDYEPTVYLRRVGAVLEKPRRTLCLDERVPFGAVGGPVVNPDGDVVGVVGLDMSPGEGGDLYIRHGHPLVYQSSLFAKFIANPPGEEEIEEDGTDAWLGVFTQPLTDDLADYWGLDQNGGVIVSSIVTGSPAEKAGILRGDVIVRFNDVPVKAKQDQEVLGFTKLVRETGAGHEVEVELLRKGETTKVQVALDEKPKTSREAEELVDEVFGLTVRELTTDVRLMLNLNDQIQGVIVRRVRSGSWAEIAGFRPGVIILRFGDYTVTSLEEFKSAAASIAEKQPDEVTVFCRVGARTGFFRIQPRWK
ncbi:MAG: PDZ domain-containing protein [bacterium]|nr:PDZ domain-containing protein [bacterium]